MLTALGPDLTRCLVYHNVSVLLLHGLGFITHGRTNLGTALQGLSNLTPFLNYKLSILPRNVLGLAPFPTKLGIRNQPGR